MKWVFADTNVDMLEQALISIAHNEDVREVISSEYGLKYVIDGFLQTQSGLLI
jgi:hypothetical protein